VIGHDLWQRRFNGAAGAVGSRLSVDGTSVTIVGVASPRFRGVDVGQPFDIAIPLGAEPLAGFFGAIGLLLSAVGLYGVTWYAISRRRGEIGIRLALGAQPSAVVRVMLTRIALFGAIGTVVGVFASVWLSRFVAPLLYGLEPRDPLKLAGSAATLASVAALAAWIPAWRATRGDPARVLREH